MFTEKGIILDINRQLAHMLGYKQTELVGKNALDCVAPESRDFVIHNIRSGFEEPYEHLALKKDETNQNISIRSSQIALKIWI